MHACSKGNQKISQIFPPRLLIRSHFSAKPLLKFSSQLIIPSRLRAAPMRPVLGRPPLAQPLSLPLALAQNLPFALAPRSVQALDALTVVNRKTSSEFGFDPVF